MLTGVEFRRIRLRLGLTQEALAEHFLLSPGGEAAMLVENSDKPHVYFMRRRNRGLVKIGVSIHPGSAGSSSQVGEDIDILHISGAGLEEEVRLHRQFARHRVEGEWFHPDPELLDFIAGLRAAA